MLGPHTPAASLLRDPSEQDGLSVAAGSEEQQSPGRPPPSVERIQQPGRECEFSGAPGEQGWTGAGSRLERVVQFRRKPHGPKLPQAGHCGRGRGSAAEVAVRRLDP